MFSCHRSLRFALCCSKCASMAWAGGWLAKALCSLLLTQGLDVKTHIPERTQAPVLLRKNVNFRFIELKRLRAFPLRAVQERTVPRPSVRSVHSVPGHKIRIINSAPCLLHLMPIRVDVYPFDPCPAVVWPRPASRATKSMPSLCGSTINPLRGSTRRAKRRAESVHHA